MGRSGCGRWGGRFCRYTWPRSSRDLWRQWNTVFFCTSSTAFLEHLGRISSQKFCHLIGKEVFHIFGTGFHKIWWYSWTLPKGPAWEKSHFWTTYWHLCGRTNPKTLCVLSICCIWAPQRPIMQSRGLSVCLLFLRGAKCISRLYLLQTFEASDHTRWIETSQCNIRKTYPWKLRKLAISFSAFSAGCWMGFAQSAPGHSWCQYLWCICSFRSPSLKFDKMQSGAPWEPSRFPILRSIFHFSDRHQQSDILSREICQVNSRTHLPARKDVDWISWSATSRFPTKSASAWYCSGISIKALSTASRPRWTKAHSRKRPIFQKCSLARPDNTNQKETSNMHHLMKHFDLQIPLSHHCNNATRPRKQSSVKMSDLYLHQASFLCPNLLLQSEYRSWGRNELSFIFIFFILFFFNF